MSRKEQKELTRRRVLSAAMNCIADRDVRDVSMHEIAMRAEVSVGALYVHFDNRDALIDALVAEHQELLVLRFRSTLLSLGEPSMRVAFDELASAYIAILQTLRPFVSLYASHMARATSTEALRSSGRAAPLVQMLNATLAVMALPTSVDLPMLAAAVVSLWRAAGLSSTARPTADAPVIAESLATLTAALFEKACPALLDCDARSVGRVMAQLLK